MAYTLSFDNSMLYGAGIESLRSIASRNQRSNVTDVILVHKHSAVTAIIDLAYKEKKNDRDNGLSGALYLHGFKSGNAAYSFSNANTIQGDSLGFGGRYFELGQSNHALEIREHDVAAAIAALNGYHGNGDAGFKRLLCILIICTSEAIRFGSVQRGIEQILSPSHGYYHADFSLYRSWDNGVLGRR